MKLLERPFAGCRPMRPLGADIRSFASGMLDSLKVSWGLRMNWARLLRECHRDPSLFQEVAKIMLHGDRRLDTKFRALEFIEYAITNHKLPLSIEPIRKMLEDAIFRTSDSDLNGRIDSALKLGK